MDSIARTSLLTAAMRAAETKRSDQLGRLFSDPYAETLAGDEGKNLLQQAIAESGEQPAIAVRTAFMDKKISNALKEGLQQIVMLAAGMDTRVYRMTFPVGVKVYELDRKEVFDYKNEKLKNHGPRCEHKSVVVDFLEDWKSPLIKAGFHKGIRTLWIAEGLMMYLEEFQVTRFLKTINALAIPEDILLCDILSRNLLEAPFMHKQLQFLAGIGAPWKFGTNEPEEFLKNLGWQAEATQPGEFAPERWPFPTVPRHLRNVPRSFYLEARKI